MRFEVNMNNSVIYRPIGVVWCLKVEQINDYLFIDTYNSNTIKISVNKMIGDE